VIVTWMVVRRSGYSCGGKTKVEGRDGGGKIGRREGRVEGRQGGGKAGGKLPHHHRSGPRLLDLLLARAPGLDGGAAAVDDEADDDEDEDDNVGCGASDCARIAGGPSTPKGGMWVGRRNEGRKGYSQTTKLTLAPRNSAKLSRVCQSMTRRPQTNV